MLSTWNSEYHRRSNHLELRLKKVRIKLTNWWIFYRYSGNPNYNPYILTSRPKNVPLISLRTEEYGGFLSNKEYVGQKWDDFWKKPDESYYYNPTNYNGNQYNHHQQADRLPLQQDNHRNNGPKQIPQTFKIYHDVYRNPKSNKVDIQVHPKKTKSLRTKRKKKKKSTGKPLQLVNQNVLEECGSLGSFERDLLESANLTISRGAVMMPFAGLRKSEITTPPYIEYETEAEQQNIQPNVFAHPQQVPNVNDDASSVENPIIDVVESAGINDIDMDDEFYYDSYYQRNNDYIKRAVSNRPNYNALGFDGDRVALQKEINAVGVIGWIANKVRPETRSTFDNRLTLDSNPVGIYQHQRIPLIQRPDFFDQQQSINNKLRQHGINQYREYQVKQYVRPERIRREKRKESKKRPISRRATESTQDNVITVLKRIRNSTTDKLRDSLAHTHHDPNNEFIENRNRKQHPFRSRFHNWRIFNGHHYTRKTSNPKLPFHYEQDVDPRKVSSITQISGFEVRKRGKTSRVGKVVKIASPAEDANVKDAKKEIDATDVSNDKENALPDEDAIFYDEYDIIADYEAL